MLQLGEHSKFWCIIITTQVPLRRYTYLIISHSKLCLSAHLKCFFRSHFSSTLKNAACLPGVSEDIFQILLLLQIEKAPARTHKRVQELAALAQCAGCAYRTRQPLTSQGNSLKSLLRLAFLSTHSAAMLSTRLR